MGLSYSHLANVEAGRRTLSEPRARQVLRRGFRLGEKEADRLLLEVHLLDHGLKDPTLRRLVIDLAQGRVPATVRRQIAQLYRGCRSLDGATGQGGERAADGKDVP